MNLFPAQVKNGRLLFPLLDADIPVPKSARIPHETDNLIAGLRPEHFYIQTHLDQQNEHVLFDTTVDVVELLGADILVYFQKEISYWPRSPALEQEVNLKKQSGDKLNFVVRLSTAHSVKENNTLKLAFDANDLHLFDPETGECLTSARG